MYTVRMPFRVPTTTRISLNECAISDGKLNWLINCSGQYHVLKVSGFPTEQEANLFIRQLPAAMANLLLEKGISPTVSFQPETIAYASDPVGAAEHFSKNFGMALDVPIDGLIDNNGVAVYPSEKNLKTISLGDVNIYITTPSNHVLQILLDGANLAGASRFESDPKLATALELYGAYFVEHSGRARFLTLIMALEALTEPAKKSQTALGLLARWQEETRTMIESIMGNDAEVASLEALKRELLFRQDESIGIQIRNVVACELQGDSDVTEQVREAKRLYNLRSTLVHKGFLEASKLDTATSSAKTLVHRVLNSRFRRVTVGA